MSKIKVVATIGPVTLRRERLLALARAGMNVARLNGSHADLAWHDRAVKLIRDTLPDVPILLDLPGRKVRVSTLGHEPSFEAGDTLTFTTDPTCRGLDKVPVDYPDLHRELSPGTVLKIDDGTLVFTVLEITGRDIVCRAEVGGTLRSRKGVNVPGVTLKAPLVSAADAALVRFAKSREIDFVGISFVESAHHVETIREVAGGPAPYIVSKIENQSGMENLDEIIAVSDAVMIDRGDLSVETSLHTLILFQKRIIERARAAGTPVIVATEMLHSMIENPYPTKAEVSDITNAVLDGCAALMLSGETAIGEHFAEAVSVMREVADTTTVHLQSSLDEVGEAQPASGSQAMEDAIALICRQLPITKIVAITVSGYAARMIAARRPRQPVLAVTNDRYAWRSFNL